MAPVLAWFRLDVRRRWRTLLVLTLLIAFAAATVMTAVAGARRGATAIDRLVAQTEPMTVLVLPNTGGFDWSVVRDLPQVEALTVWPLTQITIDGLPGETAEVYDAEAMRTVEVPVVLEGRLADPQRVDEAVVTPTWIDTYRHAVGDTVRIRLHTPQAIDDYELRSIEPDGPAGPAIDVTVVGVVRSPWFSDELESTGHFVLSPAVLDTYPANLLGEANAARTNGMVRLVGGQADIESFRAGLVKATGTSAIDVWDIETQFGERLRDVDRFEANGLLAFAAAAALAALFLVGQSVARHTAATATDLRVLAMIGLTPRQAVRAAAVGPALAAVAGTLIAIGVAVVASRWFPVGSAALSEPNPGVAVDSMVLAVGAVVVPLLVVVVALAAAARALRHLLRAGALDMPHSSRVASAAAGAGVPVPAIVGARFALEPGRGPLALPVRPALLGSIVGVGGVLAALTFSAGVDDATGNLERFGVVHDLGMFLGLDGIDYVPADDVLAATAGVDGVAGVNDTRSGVAGAGNGQLAVLSLDPVGNPLPFVVTEGRLPDADGEVSMGPASARSVGVGVGDTIDLTGTIGTSTVTVVGIGLMPELSHNFYTDGGLVTSGTYDALFDDFRFRAGFIALEEWADPEVVTAAVQEAVASVPGGEFTAAEPAEPPSPVVELEQVRALPVFLAGFLALLAIGAVGHALATAVRRRRHDLAVLRAVGMTRRQSRGVVVTQATVLAMTGLAVGVPLGVALGRTVWRYVADTTPVFYVPPVAWLALILVVPVALVAANLLAAWPGHWAASLRVSNVLRAE
jgi:hypothetical protein